MTREEFERDYCERSDITREYYAEHFLTLPCDCDNEDCKGWACINNDEISIHAHNHDWEKWKEALDKTRQEITDRWDKMNDKEHECEWVDESTYIYKENGRWWISLNSGESAIIINYCPFCAEQLK